RVRSCSAWPRLYSNEGVFGGQISKIFLAALSTNWPLGRLYTEEHMSTAAMPGPAAHNSEEFEGFFREHYLLVYRTACFITGNPNDAEDVLQTIFLRLLRRDIPPDLCKNPRGYFYKASVNASLDMLRSRRREVLTSDFTTFPAIHDPGRSEDSD